MTMLLEQNSSSQASGGTRTSRRFVWGYADLWTQTEVSAVRRFAAWLALAVSVAVAVLLLLGF